jgi:hypothetical protein
MTPWRFEGANASSRKMTACDGDDGYLAGAGAAPGTAAGVGGDAAGGGAALPVEGAGTDAAAAACGWTAGLIQQA